MNWKQKLNITNFIINESVDKYLKNCDFYKSTMNPRFFGEETYSSEIMTKNSSCLRLDTDDPKNDDYTMRIFINQKEVYMEVQNSWGGFERSYHYKVHEPLTVELVDEILDRITSC